MYDPTVTWEGMILWIVIVTWILMKLLLWWWADVQDKRNTAKALKRMANPRK